MRSYCLISRWKLALALGLAVAGAPRLQAYPEFQQFIVKNSGRTVNCAMCHTHPDGPEGLKPGQLGRLTPAELNELGRARAAFEPGAKVKNPILNEFGNHIINTIGKKKLLELRLAPAQLAEALPRDPKANPDTDLDHDGIPNVDEFLAGTNPLDKSDGDPWLLFKVNFARNLPSIILTLMATVAGLYGLRHLLLGFAAATQLKEEGEEEAGEAESAQG
jgi:hypothetical protein